MIEDYVVTEEELELITSSMEANNQQQHYQNHDDNDNDNVNVTGLCFKVMTDDQIEVLRKQISAYATLSNQLADMYKFISAQQDLTAAGILLSPLLNYYPLTPAIHQLLCSFFRQVDSLFYFIF